MQKPIVIICDLQILYHIESKTNRKPETLKRVFKKESITVWDDIETIPGNLIEVYKKRFGKEISDKAIVTEIQVCDFHQSFGPVNYTPKEGWNQYE
jgi:hypothetical protein